MPLILTGDRYIQASIVQVILPFAYQNYEPVWVGIGQLAFYACAIVVASFYIRKQLGNKTWPLVHFLSFLVFSLVLVHGLVSGTDSQPSGLTSFTGLPAARCCCSCFTASWSPWETTSPSAPARLPRRLRTRNPLFGGPVSEGARSLLQALGLDAFIAVVAVNSGPNVAGAFTGGYVLRVLAIGLVASILPPLIAWLVGRKLFKLNPAILLGTICGARHSTPALKAAQEECASAIPAIGT